MATKKNKEFPKGLNENIVRKISEIKKEPKWMLDFRLDSFKKFQDFKNPNWGPNLEDLDFQDIRYYATGGEKVNTWNEIPKEIKNTFEKLGISKEEQKLLAGLSTQYESEVMYSQIKEKWNSLGIIFETTEIALKKHPEIFKKYFSKLVPNSDNKYAALNSAVWSGGTFVYVPKGIKLTMPVQTYFRINTQNMGQFERTLIIAEEDSEIHYIEGCTAPQYMTNSLHCAVVEVFVKKNAKVRYSTMQNWSKNIYNLVTKRATAGENATMEWVDCNIGSKITMKYPATILKGDNSKGTFLSLGLSDDGQIMDSGSKMLHLGKNTKSIINSKTVSKKNGKSIYRGFCKIAKSAINSQSIISCDGLVLDKNAKSYSYPSDEISNTTSTIEHEAKISKVSQNQLKYLMSRGLSKQEASHLIVSGFVKPITEGLPMEYAVELDRILNMFVEK
jgi:Fe-S cluster assembly protein SufB